MLSQGGIDTSGILFIDAISAVAVHDLKNTKSCIYVSHPSNLTEMDIELVKAIKSPGRSFLALDSASTLFMYNPKDKVARFLSSISSLLSTHKIDTVFIAIAEEEAGELKRIAPQICDKVIYVGSPGRLG